MALAHISLDDPERFRIDESGRSVGLFCRGLPAVVNRSLIEELKQVASRYPTKNVRLCLHDGPESEFHSMVIFERQGTYYPPHRHLHKGESWHIIEGVMAVFVFHPDGRLQDARRLEAEADFLYRIGRDMIHTVMPLTEVLIYHESKPGPFLRDGDSVLPEWAPDGTDAAARDHFVNWLLRSLAERPIQSSNSP
jgi:cupin fold WbuC family metalloprotein